jgi:integrase
MSNLPAIKQEFSVSVLQKPVEGINTDEILRLKEGIKKWGEQSKSNKVSKNIDFIVDRDTLLVDFLFHTGIRISDVVGRPYEKHRKDGTLIFPWEGIKFRDINWQTQYLQFVVHKRSRKNLFVHKIILSKPILYDIMNFKQKYMFKDDDVIFEMTLQNFDQNLKKYCELAGIKYYSAHKFRHGMAIQDLSEQKPDFLTAFRLAHSSTAVTNNIYRRMNAEYERQFRGY